MRSSAMLIAAAAGLSLCTTTALAGSGVGAPFNLGTTNTVNAQSVLTGNAGSSAQLKLENTGGGPALALAVDSGVAPFKVNTSTKIGGLNADLLDGLDSSKLWKLGGNSGTTPGANFLGTTDNKALELKVNGQRVLRLEPRSASPNVIGGFFGNAVQVGSSGATIAGGGTSGLLNLVTDNFGTVGGGEGNTAGDSSSDPGSAFFASVGGGRQNTAHDAYSTVAGGTFGEAIGIGAVVGGGVNGKAKADFSVVSGGSSNQALGQMSTVAGGLSNTAVGFGSFIAGGTTNYAPGNDSFAAGDRARAMHDGTFVWADFTDAPFASTAANQFDVRAGGGAKIVRGASTFASTSAALQVEHDGDVGEAAWLRVGSASNATPVLSLVKQATGTGNFLQCWNQSSSFGSKCFIDKDGAYHAGADFAESVRTLGPRAGYEPGDVLSISRTHAGVVIESHRPFDRALIGVYSTRPGFVGADDAGVTRAGENHVPVAITGIVPVKATTANGPIRPGDLLTSSSERGRAMSAGRRPAIGTVLGKSLGFLRRGRGVVKMLVMPR
jgi:hypothetical protein